MPRAVLLKPFQGSKPHLSRTFRSSSSHKRPCRACQAMALMPSQAHPIGIISTRHCRWLKSYERACEVAQTHGAYRLRAIRELIKRTGHKQEQFEFITEHPIIRRLSDYGDLVRDAFQETPI